MSGRNLQFFFSSTSIDTRCTDPASAEIFPGDYHERVKAVHEVGGYGSIGYGYNWKVEEAEKLLLRTHTTAVSSNMLYQLAQEVNLALFRKRSVLLWVVILIFTCRQKNFRPAKYFSIDRVFRNETTDATHLAEFHQLEGLVIDRGLTLGDLIGTLDVFFKKLGTYLIP